MPGSHRLRSGKIYAIATIIYKCFIFFPAIILNTGIMSYKIYDFLKKLVAQYFIISYFLPPFKKIDIFLYAGRGINRLLKWEEAWFNGQ